MSRWNNRPSERRCGTLHRSFPSLFLLWLVFDFVCRCSLFWVQFELKQNGYRESCTEANWSVSASNSSRLCRLQTLCYRQRQAGANQLLPTSPVAKTLSVDRPESTESVTDWANRTGAIGLLSILNTEAWWENTEILWYSQTSSLTNSYLCVLWPFSPNRTQKVADVYHSYELQL